MRRTGLRPLTQVIEQKLVLLNAGTIAAVAAGGACHEEGCREQAHSNIVETIGSSVSDNVLDNFKIHQANHRRIH
jgi:hypothetical protein